LVQPCIGAPGKLSAISALPIAFGARAAPLGVGGGVGGGVGWGVGMGVAVGVGGAVGCLSAADSKASPSKHRSRASNSASAARKGTLCAVLLAAPHCIGCAHWKAFASISSASSHCPLDVCTWLRAPRSKLRRRQSCRAARSSGAHAKQERRSLT